ncbi:MAG: hypothetical protein JNJ59_10155 [Deltaproteobacteria bacterium]|nr:hypothetical protein [Deltaproteobacteria bacterium]
MVANPETPSPVLLAPQSNLASAVSLAISLGHGCAMTGPLGKISCWGSNYSGQLGRAEPGYFEFARQIPEIVGATQLTVGGQHSCSLVGGVVKCWGSNWSGQLGVPGEDTPIPQPVNDLSDVVEMRAYANTSCVRLGGGTVKCWGSNTGGILGDGSGIEWSATPVVVSNIQRATAIGMSASISCAIEEGGVWCWGENWNGALGDGTTQQRSTPVQVILP